MIQISPQQIYVGKSSFVKGILDWIRTLRSGNYVNILQAISLDCEPTFLGSCFVFVISFADQDSTTPIVQREWSSVNEHCVLEEHDKLISLHYQLMNYNIILDRMFAFAAISGCNVRVGDVSGWDVLLWMA
ncbi:hypothetical protein TNCT_513001 [Trichonephila clavata]|uniref:Uncharacterized protein n=1 Tax=Trichonephila clavata TaxID=2740835 RepID=A0A8X6HJK2_TRICU|nr:hypothetical protein TNCT_513001 [Trichonephila clavata]